MPDKDGLIRSVKLRIRSKNKSDQTLICQTTQNLFCLLEMKMCNSPKERPRTKFGRQNGIRRFAGSQMKVLE